MPALREIQRLALSSDVSAEERRELARRGHALPDGSYPIGDAKHLHSAAVLAASGHGDVAAARKLIRKRAAELGVDLRSLPGFSQDDEDLKEQAQRDRKRRRAAHHGEAPRRGQDRHGPGGHGSSDDDYTGGGEGPSGQGEGGSMAASRALMRRSDGSLTTIELTGAQEEELGLAAGGDDGPVGYYVRMAAEEFAPDGGVTSGATYKPPFRVHDAGSSQDGESITDVEAEISRYLRQAGGLSKEKPSGSSVRYPPGSPAARRRAEQRELAGGRPQSWPR